MKKNYFLGCDLKAMKPNVWMKFIETCGNSRCFSCRCYKCVMTLDASLYFVTGVYFEPGRNVWCILSWNMNSERFILQPVPMLANQFIRGLGWNESVGGRTSYSRRNTSFISCHQGSFGKVLFHNNYILLSLTYCLFQFLNEILFVLKFTIYSFIFLL